MVTGCSLFCAGALICLLHFLRMNIFRFFASLRLAIAANVSLLCAQPSALPGSWKVDENSVPLVMEVAIVRTGRSNPGQAEQLKANPKALQNIVQSLVYTFREDGVYLARSLQGEQSGKWRIDGNNLVTEFAGMPERRDSLLSITPQQLRLFNRDIRQAITYLPAAESDGSAAPKPIRSGTEPGPAEKDLLRPHAITRVHVVDVKKGRLLEDYTVIWKAGKITDVLPANRATLPPDAVQIDGRGKFLIPGLMDSHIHFFQSAGLYTRPDGLDFRMIMPYEKDQQWIRENHHHTMKRYLATGITTVVDVGGPFYNFTIRDSINSRLPAPRTIVTGPLISTYAPPNLDERDPPIIKAHTPEEAREQVRRQLPFKPAFIKIWFVILPGQTARQFEAEVAAAIDEAHRHHLRVAIHATEYETAKEAIRLGADILVHSIEDADVNDDFLKLLKSKNIVYIPTLQVGQQFFRMLTQKLDFTTHELAWADPTQLGSLFDLRHLDPKKLNGFDYRPLVERFPIPSKSDSIMLRNLKRVAQHGITIATGTDAGNPGVAHGASYMREILLMQEAGLTPHQVLRASTLDAARAFQVDSQHGSIEKGKFADFVLLEENPLKSLRAIEEISMTFLNGRGYRPEDLLPKNVDELAKAEVNAYNARNIDAFVARYAPTAEIYDLANPTTPIAVGHDQIRRTWGALFDQFPDLHCEVTSRTIIGNRCVAIESITGVGPQPEQGVGIYYFNLETGLIEKVYFMN